MSPKRQRSKRKIEQVEKPRVVLISQLKTNEFGGVAPQKTGVAYSVEKKAEVANVYVRLIAEQGGDKEKVSISKLSREAKVSRNVARKVKAEVDAEGGVLDPFGIRKRARQTRGVGPGACTLSNADRLVLRRLQEENPKRNLASYQEELLLRNGTTVSLTTIGEVLRVQGGIFLELKDEQHEGGGNLGIQKPAREYHGKGTGAWSLSEADRLVLRQIQQENPMCTLDSYKEQLLARNGTQVSIYTITGWFRENGGRQKIKGRPPRKSDPTKLIVQENVVGQQQGGVLMVEDRADVVGQQEGVLMGNKGDVGQDEQQPDLVEDKQQGDLVQEGEQQGTLG